MSTETEAHAHDTTAIDTVQPLSGVRNKSAGAGPLPPCSSACRCHTLLERIPDVIWTASADGELISLTPSVTEVLGYSPEEICGEDSEAQLARVHPDDRACAREAFARAAAGQTPSFEYRQRHKSGHWVWLRTRTLGRYESGGATFIEGMWSDISEKKALEDSLRQAQKLEAVARLTGGIAHDFNNILAAILTNVHFLMTDLSADDPRRLDAQEIKTAAERAASLTRQLLAFSRRQGVEPAEVDLNTVVLTLEQMLRRLIGEDVELSVVCEEGLGSVHVNARQIEQVIMNLVVNARDAMPKGGKLTIATRSVELTAQHTGPRALPAGRYALLSVTDTGSGMDNETKRHLFEPFFTTKEEGKGTGLGLSTCHDIVRQNAGDIRVSSELGRGSVFDVYLPQVATKQAEPVRQTPAQPVVGGSEKILLVEDDMQVRNAVGRLLTDCGYELLCASNATDALAIAERHRGDIDLVVSDVVMPGPSGTELVEELRKRRREVPALLMSGHIEHLALEGAQSGVQGFVEKPFLPEALALKVRQALDA